MLSAIIATHESECALVPTLAALVAGAAAGILREVIVADAGSKDATAEITDVAGCRLLVAPGTPGARLAAGAKAARAPWLLFLRPGIVLDAAWVDAARQVLAGDAGSNGAVQAAVFRPGAATGPTTLGEGMAPVRAALAPPRPAQGPIRAQ